MIFKISIFWYRFDIAEADIIVPVTLNSMSILKSTFLNCYLSQRAASFPSHEFDGPFCDLSQKIWVEQHKELQLLLGRDYWYQNKNPHLRSVHGAVYLKEMKEYDLALRLLNNLLEENIEDKELLYLTSLISKFLTPAGVVISTKSLLFLPIKPFPIGD